MRRVLVLSPHTDDAELHAGGTIARFVEEGAEVRIVALSTGNAETGAHVAEFEAAMEVLGVTDYILHDYTTRRFPAARQEILDLLVALRTPQPPDLVFVPSTTDRHQDHQVVTAEALRAFRDTSLLGYALPTNHTLPADLRHFVTLERQHVDAKVMAIACYRSQANKPQTGAEFLYWMARITGVQCGAEFAEAFEVLREVQ